MSNYFRLTEENNNYFNIPNTYLDTSLVLYNFELPMGFYGNLKYDNNKRIF